MGVIWFTSDTHFGHRKVSELRGFNTTMAHDFIVLDNIARKVGPDDILYVMGDLALSQAGAAFGIAQMKTIKAKKKILILGNHDRAHPIYANSQDHVAKYLDGFDSVVLGSSLNHNGFRFILSHFPYGGDSGDEDRHEQWRPRDLGKPIIHGHTHSTDRLTFSGDGTPQIHVGLDAWGLEPVSIHEITALLRANGINSN